jgi:hypothetical protein
MKVSKAVVAFSFSVVLVASHLYGQLPNTATARQLVKQSISAMGGEAWASVQTLMLEGYGNSQSIDQSERPEGPYIPQQVKSTFIRDLVHNRGTLTLSTQTYNFNAPETYVLDGSYVAMKYGGKLYPVGQDQTITDELFLAPEKLLTNALEAKDLAYIKDTIVQQAQHALLSFHWGKYPVRFFLNRETSFITAVTVTKPYKDNFLSIWGDSQKTIFYSFWNFIGKGLHYPLQQDCYINGWYKSSYMINKWEVNSIANTDSLSIPDSIKLQEDGIAKRTLPAMQSAMDKQAKEIAPGVWLLLGPCNSTVIEQPDGIVVIEASAFSAYGELLIAKAHQLFPGKKIKALISTSDAWLHIGGVRAFAALPGITIYHPYRNQFILQKLLHANYHTSPDVFATKPVHDYTLKGVRDSVVIGRGDNTLVLYPYLTETGDRQMMVYFPHRQLLYTSDLYQPKGQDGQYFVPHYAWEVYHSISSRKLPVKQFYGMHTASLIDYSELENDFSDY